MAIDKNIEHMMKGTTSVEEHKKMMQILQTKRNDPVVQLSLAMFRDSIVFRDMANSMIFGLNCRVQDLSKEVSDLREELNDANCEESESEAKQ